MLTEGELIRLSKRVEGRGSQVGLRVGTVVQDVGGGDVRGRRRLI